MYLAFYKGKGNFIDKLIRFFTKSKYSHVELLFSDDRYFSADAWTNTVRYTNFTANPTNWDLVKVDGNEVKARFFCNRVVNAKYDFLGVLFFFFNLGDTNSRWFCSEVCTKALQEAGNKLVIGLRPCKVSPKTLYNTVVGSK